MSDIDSMLRKIAKELEISSTEFDRAVQSYNAVGTYLDNNISNYNVRVVPQGSFRLGTVIKPISDEDEYDIDLVAILDNDLLTASELKNVVGEALKNSDRYSKKLKEGKRCWTIEYADSANFHMDILPTKESNTYQTNKELIMTHKENKNSNYEFRTTSPEAYYEWFTQRMEEEKMRLTEEYAFKNSKKINEVKEYDVKTTLQIAIELVKRYRDIVFQEIPDIKPISIIITTLMAEIYTGRESVYELIDKFSKYYNDFLEYDERGNYLIKNPVNDKENFADKWAKYPERKRAFFEFMTGLRENLITNKSLLDGTQIEQANIYKSLFGENVINKVYENKANETRIARENGNVYIKENGNITTEKTDVKVKDHTFYGN